MDLPRTRLRHPRRASALAALATAGLLAAALGACSSDPDEATVDPGGDVLTADAPTSTGADRPSTTSTSTDDATDDGDPAPDACELLSEAEVSDAFGEPAVTTTDRYDECWWSSADDLRTANLIVRSDELAEWRSGYDNATWEPNDLGDEGYTSKVLGSVVWRVGDDQYEVNVVYSTSGNDQAAAEALADLAAARL